MRRACRESGIEIFYFSAFNEEWQAGPEGDSGAHWGFRDTAGRYKYEG